MNTTIRKSWTFDAAHQLPNHDGKCRRPHGHTYTVTVEVSGEIHQLDGAPSEGMVCDFAVLDKAWRQVEGILDHQDLNVTLAGLVGRTTSELMATYLFGYFGQELATEARLESVTVSETAATSATVRR